ncbi:MAG: type 1 glutamine amidotransferase domain-containing protein [Bacteroidota bacterium]
MSRKRKIIKWSLIVFVTLILSLVGFGFWFMSLVKTPADAIVVDIEKTLPQDIDYLTKNKPVPVQRGKILAVVTSHGEMGSTEKPTGYELTELSRAYYVFEANGFEVDVASPLGGKPPVVIDDEDMGLFDYAFLNDPEAKQKTSNTLAMAEVNPDEYEAVYFVGGKGAMWDFPENKHIQSIVSQYYESGKVVSAVCHGPAALVNVTLSDGSSLLKDKKVSSFTNSEELFLIKDAASIFPFLLQDKLEEQGAIFNEGNMYLENVSHDGNLVTGQNPWSTWTMAETVIKQLGYEPKKREKTEEENAVQVLLTFEHQGYGEAKKKITNLITVENKPINRELIGIHGILAVMQWDIGKFANMVGLLWHVKWVTD